MTPIRCEAQITSLRSRADRSFGLTIITPELSGPDKLALLNLQNVLLEMALFPKDASLEEVQIVKNKLLDKTPSQRMREALFKLYSAKRSKEPFETFYQHQMSRLIQAVLDRAKQL